MTRAAVRCSASYYTNKADLVMASRIKPESSMNKISIICTAISVNGLEITVAKAPSGERER
jgi:hypothetical protein